MNIETLTAKGAVILINKASGWTSFDVVKKIRGLVKRKVEEAKKRRQITENKKIKVGHAGTLDPLATGLLIVCIGKETKNAEKYQAEEKEYTGTIALGATTPCYDLEKPIDRYFPVQHISDEMIRSSVKIFIGESEQTPPVFSAKNIEGERAYLKARRGEEVKMKNSRITISEFEINKIRRESELIKIDFRVVCSKGTYIRSLANDLGKMLNSGAYLEKLCRTRSGNFRLEKAVTIEEFTEKMLLIS